MKLGRMASLTLCLYFWGTLQAWRAMPAASRKDEPDETARSRQEKARMGMATEYLMSSCGSAYRDSLSASAQRPPQGHALDKGGWLCHLRVHSTCDFRRCPREAQARRHASKRTDIKFPIRQFPGQNASLKKRVHAMRHATVSRSPKYVSYICC